MLNKKNVKKLMIKNYPGLISAMDQKLHNGKAQNKINLKKHKDNQIRKRRKANKRKNKNRR